MLFCEEMVDVDIDVKGIDENFEVVILGCELVIDIDVLCVG